MTSLTDWWVDHRPRRSWREYHDGILVVFAWCLAWEAVCLPLIWWLIR